ISFGAPALSEPRELHKTVLVYNASSSKRRYSVSADFRDPTNAATAAARFELPSSIDIGPRGFRFVDVEVRIDPGKLATWTLNGGPQGGNGQLQTALELDGHVTIKDAIDTVRLTWSILPHKDESIRVDEHTE